MFKTYMRLLGFVSPISKYAVPYFFYALLYALFNRLFGYTAANSWGNVLDNILCILFAYATNRAFVFNSKTRGRAMAKEFGAFVTCRLGTCLLYTSPSPRDA